MSWLFVCFFKNNTRFVLFLFVFFVRALKNILLVDNTTYSVVHFPTVVLEFFVLFNCVFKASPPPPLTHTHTHKHTHTHTHTNT